MTMKEDTDDALAELKLLKVPLYEWLERRDELISEAVVRKLKLALVVSSDDELRFSPDDLNEIEMVIIEFTSLIDGRGFSLAVMLREKFHFRGGIRAVNVLEDNVAYLEECGFDSFELDSGKVFSSCVQDIAVPNHSPIGFAQRLNRLKFN